VLSTASFSRSSLGRYKIATGSIKSAVTPKMVFRGQ
jgi:hypothetical protein